MRLQDEQLIDLSRSTPLKCQHAEPERKRQFRKLLGDGEGTQAAALRCGDLLQEMLSLRFLHSSSNFRDIASCFTLPDWHAI